MEMAFESNDRQSICMEEFYYDSHEHHTIALYQPAPRRDDPRAHNAIWLIYIHGGAWRDPMITDRSFQNTVNILLSSRWTHKIKGYASLSYRLSPHPKYEELPSTPENSRREAKHPDHINDIMSALVFLLNSFRIGQRYILVGHSCGATLAFQTLMKQFSQPKFPMPSGIVGIAGIYNIRGLRDRNPDPVYEEFISGAFGKDEAVWDSASPVNIIPSDNPWPGGRLALLVSSTEDELIESEQLEEMKTTLRGYEGLKVVTWRQMLHCSHDDIWKTDLLAEVLLKAIEQFYYG